MRFGSWLSVQVLRALPRKRLSRAVGRWCDVRLPRLVSRGIQRVYGGVYGVDMTDVAPRPDAYPSFDAFFTRPLRPGARAIGDARVVAPADGRLVATGPIEAGARFRVKAQDYVAHDLIGEAADTYIGGSYAVVYLAPGDYHRVHAPVDGTVRMVRGIAGDLFPVNTLGERHVPSLLVRNERVVVFVDTETLGRVAVGLVGALFVGRITVPMLPAGAVQPGDHPIDPPTRVRRGDEIGTFHLGSTVVLLVDRHAVLSRGIGRLQYGQALSSEGLPD
jgi:phosphatidylserine decarboxylase